MLHHSQSEPEWQGCKKRGITEVRHWCWAINSSSWSVFQFLLKVLVVADVGVYCRPVKPLQPESHFFMHLTLWTWALSLWKRKKALGICYHKCGQALLSNAIVPVFFSAWLEMTSAPQKISVGGISTACAVSLQWFSWVSPFSACFYINSRSV